MIKPLKIDWTFYCYKCGGMASMKTCPHGKDDRLLLSGTKLRKMLSEGEDVPKEFSRPEVLVILQEYYRNLELRRIWTKRPQKDRSAWGWPCCDNPRKCAAGRSTPVPPRARARR